MREQSRLRQHDEEHDKTDMNREAVKSSRLGINRSMTAQIVAQDGGGAVHNKRNEGTLQKKRDAMHKKRNRGVVRKKRGAMHKKHNGDAVRKKRGGLKSLGRRICSGSKKRAAAAAIQRNSYSSMTDNKSLNGFDEMVAGTPRYYVLGGKGSVGKTSMAASLAVKFAGRGESTLIASTDPAHSLGDSFEQDLSDGKIVPVNGVDSLFAVEVGHVKRKEEPSNGGSWIRDLLGKIGLEVGTDLGHTLNLLYANDWMEKLLGVAIKVANVASSDPDLKSTFGKDQIDPAKLEE